MGTNYYHRYDACDCCGRYDERHICKSMTSFQGYRPDPMWPDDFAGPLVTTWRQWRDVISAGGEVWDECGRKWDSTEFIAGVEATRPEARRRQYDWMVNHSGNLERDWHEHVWIDPDGFSFSDQEFS